MTHRIFSFDKLKYGAQIFRFDYPHFCIEIVTFVGVHPDNPDLGVMLKNDNTDATIMSNTQLKNTEWFLYDDTPEQVASIYQKIAWCHFDEYEKHITMLKKMTK